jgi:DNA-binding transcriptional MerR regulator
MMNIKDAERLSGVSVRNIRFYEQKGLLKPARNAENDYREYCEEDIRRLQLIRALRMVDMPLEQIREVVDGRTELRQAALLQKEKLEEQIKKIKTVMKFCEELSQTDPDQVSEVLMRMDEPENRKILFKRWKFDYAEFARNNLLPLGAGALPMAIGLIVVFPLLLARLFAPAYIITLTLLVQGFWGYLGYRLYRPNSWKKRIILFFYCKETYLSCQLFCSRNSINKKGRNPEKSKFLPFCF